MAASTRQRELLEALPQAAHRAVEAELGSRASHRWQPIELAQLLLEEGETRRTGEAETVVRRREVAVTQPPPLAR